MRKSHNQKAIKEEGSSYLRSEQKRNPNNGVEKIKEGTADGKKLERQTTEDINESAEAFIKNFRQHLLIQRLQSLENYEQMLARGL